MLQSTILFRWKRKTCENIRKMDVRFTRVINLEMIFSRDPNVCFSTYTRFIARLGHSSIVWMDKGTNFVVDTNDMNQFASLSQDTVSKEKLRLTQIQIVWNFNPQLRHI